MFALILLVIAALLIALICAYGYEYLCWGEWACQLAIGVPVFMFCFILLAL